MIRYAPFTPVITVKCEWCGHRIATENAIMEAQTHMCYCSEACFGHAGALREAVLLALASDYVYTGPRGVKEHGVVHRPAWHDLVAQAMRDLYVERKRNAPLNP